MEEKAMIIYLEDVMLLSKKPYKSWREVQDEYDDQYKANLGPMTKQEIIHFFEEDFGEESAWPFSKETIEAFFHGAEVTISDDK